MSLTLLLPISIAQIKPVSEATAEKGKSNPMRSSSTIISPSGWVHFGSRFSLAVFGLPYRSRTLGDSIGSTWRLNLCATHDVEGDVGNQVQEKYADLEDRHPGVDHAFRKKSIPLFSFPQRLERNAVVERLERASIV